MPGLAAKRKTTSRPATAVHLDLQAGLRQGQVGELGRDRRVPAARRRRPAGRGHLGLGAARAGRRRPAARRRARRPRRRGPPASARRRSALVAPRRSPRPGSRRTCGAAPAGSGGAPDRGQPLGIALDRLAPCGACRPQRRPARRRGRRGARRRSANGRPVVESGQGDGQAVTGAALAGQRLDGCRGRLAVPGGIGQDVGLGRERGRPRRRSVSSAAGQLLDLEAQQVDLPGPFALVAAQRRRGAPRPRPAPCGRCAAARGRSRRSGRGPRAGPPGVSSDWWSCWPWRSTSAAPRLAQLGQRGQVAVDVPADRPDAGTTRRSTTSSSSTTKRPSTTASVAPGRTMPDSARPPTSSSMAVTTRVLPAPVSPVTAVIPGPSTSDSSAITPRSRTRSSLSTRRRPSVSGQRSARPNLAFRMAWKSRGPKVTSRATWPAARQLTDIARPGARREPDRRPPGRRAGARTR